MKEIYELLEKIEVTKGTNAKAEILFQLIRNYPEAEELLHITYNNDMYGVSTRSFEKLINYDASSDGAYFDAGELIKPHSSGFASWNISQVREFLEDLQRTSGNSRLEVLSRLLTLQPLEAKWLARVILKDLKMGISLITINKVLKQMGKPKIVKFEVQLAGKFDDIRDPKIAEVVGFPCLAGIKYDGERGFLFKKGAEATFMSRQGKVIDYVPELLEYFSRNATDFVLDGEILCKDFSSLQQRIGRNLENITPIPSLHFRLFDVIEHDGRSYVEESQEVRSKFIQSLKESDFLKLEETRLIEDYDQLEEFYKLAIERKEEGIILKKLDATYDYGSRKNWWKVKPIFEATLRITGKKLGTGKNAGLISTIFVEDSSGEVTSGVGSGLTENDIVLLMNLEREGKLVGTCVDVAYNELTINKHGDKSLRFPRLLKIRHDKTEPDTLGEAREPKESLQGYF